MTIVAIEKKVDDAVNKKRKPYFVTALEEKQIYDLIGAHIHEKDGKPVFDAGWSVKRIVGEVGGNINADHVRNKCKGLFNGATPLTQTTKPKAAKASNADYVALERRVAILERLVLQRD